MAKKMKKAFSMFLVLCMMAGMFSVPALAAEETVVESSTNYVDENGNNVVVATTETNITDTNENGAVVDTKITFTTTTVTDENGNIVSNTWAEDGIEKTEETTVATGTVEIPSTEGESSSVTSGDAVGSETIIEGSEESGNYTKETVTQQGSITVETTDIEVKENFSEITTDMEHISADVTPTDDNDLIYTGGNDTAPEEYLPGYEGEAVIPENPNGYDYIYVGSGNTSQFFPGIVYEDPMTDEEKLAMYGDNAYIKNNSITWYYVKWLKEDAVNNLAKDENGKYITDEEGYILDKDGNRVLKEERTEKGPNGETTYLHRFDNYGNSLLVEGWFENGEWVKEMNGKDAYYGVWSGPQQFILVDNNG
ncbi:MAG: hypothetical protein IJD81_01415, partial [Oscillospiraceae bacterium]|nr:hypothetical protein [Oscillospiraceae bacterium]